MNGSDWYGYIKFVVGPIWDAELRVWDAKNFGLVSPGTHRNKFVKKSLGGGGGGIIQKPGMRMVTMFLM